MVGCVRILVCYSVMIVAHSTSKQDARCLMFTTIVVYHSVRKYNYIFNFVRSKIGVYETSFSPVILIAAVKILEQSSRSMCSKY